MFFATDAEKVYIAFAAVLGSSSPVHTAHFKTRGASIGEDDHFSPLSDILCSAAERRVILHVSTDKLLERSLSRKMAPVDNLTCVLHAKGDMRLVSKDRFLA